jgi:hypothetical protein
VQIKLISIFTNDHSIFNPDSEENFSQAKKNVEENFPFDVSDNQ